MSLLEYFGVKPTPESFARRLLRALPRDDGQWDFDPERHLLRHPGGMEISLQNMFLEYRGAPVSQRGALIRKYADLAVVQSREIPGLWAAASRNVYPVLRSQFVDTIIEIRSRAGEAKFDPVALPLAADLRIRLVYDFGNFVSYVREEQLKTWARSAEEVLPHALANLGRLQTPEWIDSERGFLRLSSPDSYGESMLQLDSVLAALPFAAHAALMPCNRGILLAADGRSEAALEAMLDEALRCTMHEPWPMSGAVLRRGAQGGWESLPVPDALEPRARSLARMHASENYSVQKDELDAFHQACGRDVFVASYGLLGTATDLRSYCTWAEGVVSLLPETDWVAVIRTNEKGEPGEHLRVDWADLFDVVGARLASTTEAPPRFLVDSFPSEDEWRALAARSSRLQ